MRHEDDRPSASARGYGRTWQRLRRMVLAREPVCRSCQREPASEVDHIIALDKGGTNAMENLQGLCKPCHSRKTRAVDGRRQKGQWQPRKARAARTAPARRQGGGAGQIPGAAGQ